MWWTPRDKKKEDDRARIQMELALASLPKTTPCWEEVKAKMDHEERVRKVEYEQHSFRMASARICVPMLEETNQLAEGEYEKWLLDETGTYTPKLIKTKKDGDI